MSAVSEAYCATGREIALCATSLLPRFSVFYDAAPGLPALRGIRPSMAKKKPPVLRGGWKWAVARSCFHDHWKREL